MFDFIKEHCENTYLDLWYEERLEFYNWPDYYVFITMLSALLNLAAFLAALYTIGAILANKQVRHNSFNIFVICLLIPDALNASVGFFWEFYRIYRCGKIPKKLGDFYDINTFFYFVCNFTLNVVVAWELHRLLEKAQQVRRTGPPPLRRTLWMVLGAYVFAILFAAWGAVDTHWTWYYLGRHRFGSPPGPNAWFTEVQAMAFVGTLMLAEILFVVVCRFIIWKKGLLPRKGRTRVASLFFERIVIVFLVFYFPTVALLMVTAVIGFSYDATYFWIERTIQFLGALQVFVTLWVVAQKPDIQSAITCGYGCCCCRKSTTAPSNSTSPFVSRTGHRVSVTGRTVPHDNSNPDRVVISSELLSSELINSALVSEAFANPALVETRTAVSEWDMDDLYGSDVEEIVFRSDSDDDEEIGSGGVIGSIKDAHNDESGIGDKLFIDYSSNSNELEDVNEDHAIDKETTDDEIHNTGDKSNDDGGDHQENGEGTLPVSLSTTLTCSSTNAAAIDKGERPERSSKENGDDNR